VGELGVFLGEVELVGELFDFVVVFGVFGLELLC
jgi:hypothetical protein